MRVALIAETFTTGVGRHVADLMRALCARGYEVHLLHGLARCDAGLVAEVRPLPGAHLCGVPMARAPHPQDVRSLWIMANYLRKHGPFDVLHGHSSKGGVCARLLALAFGVRCVYTPHALVTLAPNLGTARRIYATAERLLARVTDTIICCSQDEYAHALKLGLGAGRCAIVPHGLDSFDAAPLGVRARLALSPGVLLAGFVGRLETQKAPERLLEAMILLHRRGAPVHLAVAGEGRLRPLLEARLAEAGAQHCVSWLGAVDGRRLMREIDLLVMPSRYEGFPYVLLEALRCGVPVVATPVGGVAETLADGQCGTVVPHGDTPALAAAIERLARDPALCAGMSTQARARAERFTVKEMAQRVETFYRGRPRPVAIGS